MSDHSALQDPADAGTGSPISLRPIAIFDTTLRDGEQAPGNAMSIGQKTHLASVIADLGVDTIEAGFPAASEVDYEAIIKIAPSLTSTKISVLARARESDIEIASRSISRARDAEILLLATASDIHLSAKRGISRAQALEELTAAIAFAQKLGCADLSVGAEDATRSDRTFLRELCLAAASAGAKTFVIADTVGCMLPHQMADLVREATEWASGRIRLSVHTHDDLGLAVANAVAAVHAGATEVQATLCGIGERAGNASLEEIVACLTTHEVYYQTRLSIDQSKLFSACNEVAKAVGLVVPPNKAIVGSNAFSTAAGIHQAALLKDLRTYEFLNPERFGARRSLVISRHSGRHAVRAKIETTSSDDIEHDVQLLHDQISTSPNTAIARREILHPINR